MPAWRTPEADFLEILELLKNKGSICRVLQTQNSWHLGSTACHTDVKIKSRHLILCSMWEEESHISWSQKAEQCKSQCQKAIFIGFILVLHWDNGKENGNYYIIVGYI